MKVRRIFDTFLLLTGFYVVYYIMCFEDIFENSVKLYEDMEYLNSKNVEKPDSGFSPAEHGLFTKIDGEYNLNSHNSQFVVKEESLIEYLSSSQNCEKYLDTISRSCVVKVNNNISRCFPINEHQIYDKYVKIYSNPEDKIYHKLPKLILPKISGNNIKFPKHYKEKMDVVLLTKSVEERRKMRINIYNDDDVTLIPVVAEERLRKVSDEIPNIVHFLWFSCHRFHVNNFIAVLSAHKYQKPKIILFHTDCEPNNSEYWPILKKIVGSKLIVVKRTQLSELFGRKININQHKGDIVTLEVLLEIGGIYLETDSLVLKSLDIFRKHELVLTEWRTGQMGHSVILAHKDSHALQRWYNEYHHYKATSVDHSKVIVPWLISKYWPRKVYNVTKPIFMQPLYPELNLLYKHNLNWKKIRVFHLWMRKAVRFDGFVERPLRQLAILNTTYGEIARYVIWGNETRFKIKNWMYTCDLESIIFQNHHED